MSTTTTLQRDIDNLTTLASADLSALFQQVQNAAEARQALNDILPALVETYGLAAGALAAEWYDDARSKAGVGGGFRALPGPAPSTETRALTNWALDTATDLTTARSLVVGGVQRRVANVARGTIMRSTAADRKAVGWMRVGAGACAFCRMLIARGAVYTEATAFFGAHDNCNCQAAPKWPGATPIDVEKYRKGRYYIEDDEKRAADVKRAKEWIAKNMPEGPAIARF